MEKSTSLRLNGLNNVCPLRYIERYSRGRYTWTHFWYKILSLNFIVKMGDIRLYNIAVYQHDTVLANSLMTQ
uniref:Uncharacterized protein n=1 Tax=Rhizophora mucronata TaxID=61149 RepID=A0A2P2QXB4_RHIMU